MGKAARLNRERREKAMREDPDRGKYKADVFIKQSRFSDVKLLFTDSGFSDDLALTGVKNLMAGHVIMAQDNMPKEAKNESPEITLHILRDEDYFWVKNEVEVLTVIDFKGKVYEAGVTIKDKDHPWKPRPLKWFNDVLSMSLICSFSVLFYGEGESF
jgi:hypothetical protein